MVSSASNKQKQEQHHRIVQSTRPLITSIFFIVLGILLFVTILTSYILDIVVLPIRESASGTSTLNEIDIGLDNNNQVQNQPQNIQLRNVFVTGSSVVPYFPPFAPIPNGERLAAKVLDGTEPTIGGIVHLLNQFLRDLRHSNQNLRDVSNDRSGQDIVRMAYHNLAKQHLVPFDRPYRGRNIFPVRVEEDSIFISLAAYREHLLYETLVGAYGQAVHPEKIFVGVVMQNCFGIDDETGDEYECFTGVEVVGTDEKGRPITKVSKRGPDINGVEKFCNDTQFSQYCTSGQVRVLSVHESESLGPAIARYYASKLWGGETYYLQVDSHLEFTPQWDQHYITEIKATNHYPKSILSMYPPGFGHLADITPGTRICTCEFTPHEVEDHIIRINNGESYTKGVDYPYPTQIPFIAAGFFFTRAEFLKDIPFDPFLPWCFMGEEIALSMRAWTSGWNIYAPRKNWIAHQYRPGRMGLPKFWETVGRVFKRSIVFSNKLQGQVVIRVKYMTGYPEVTDESLKDENLLDVIEDMQYYGLGTNRSRDAYVELTNMDFVNKKCNYMKWCNKGELK